MKNNETSTAAPASKKAWEQAYEIIEQLILSTQIEPGELVTEISLAERLNLSRTPVREALKMLEQKGLIVTQNGRKRVYILSIQEINEIFDLKVCIEGGTAKWASIRGQADDFDALERIMDEMKQFVSQRPGNDQQEEEEAWLKKWLDIDKRLHGLLFKMASNRKSEDIIKNLNTQWHRLKVGILTMEGRIEKAVLEHEKFVQAVLNCNPAAAEEAMKDHLENLRRELIKLLKLFHYPST